MGIGIGRFCPGKMGFKPHWDRDLFTGNGKKMLKKIGMGFENCEARFEKKMNLEMVLVPPSDFRTHLICRTGEFNRVCPFLLFLEWGVCHKCYLGTKTNIQKACSGALYWVWNTLSRMNRSDPIYAWFYSRGNEEKAGRKIGRPCLHFWFGIWIHSDVITRATCGRRNSSIYHVVFEKITKTSLRMAYAQGLQTKLCTQVAQAPVTNEY